MSHFTVLVIGDNVDKQLEKYDENLEMPEYVEGEVSEEEMQRFVDYYTKESEEPIKLGTSDQTLLERFEEIYAIKGDDWNSNTYKKINGVWSEVSTYNPESKWDWYVTGGRWAGFFKLKSNLDKELKEIGFTRNEFENLVKLKSNNLAKFHATVDKYIGYEERIKWLVSVYNATGKAESTKSGVTDSAKKGDIDFEAMRVEDRDNAIAKYEMAEKIFGGEIPKITLSFEDAQKDSIKEDGSTDYDKAREKYWAQPAMVLITEARKRNDLTDRQKEWVIWADLSDYQCTKEEYGQKAYNDAISTYAVVKDGIWYEKGEMGWFGMSNDKHTQEEWNAELNKLIDSVSDDTLFTLIDAHI